MSEEEKIEERPEDEKFERPEEVDSNLPPEHIVTPAAPLHQASEIPKSEINQMEVHHHPIPHKAAEKKNSKNIFWNS